MNLLNLAEPSDSDLPRSPRGGEPQASLDISLARLRWVIVAQALVRASFQTRQPGR